MNSDTLPAHDWRSRLKHEWLLLLFAALTLVLAVVDPQPLTRYRHWLQLPTLSGLLGLLIAIQGIRDSGLIQRLAGMMVARMHSLRGVGLLLVSMTAVLSTVLTNDVSLFLVVPLTVAIGSMSNLPILRMAVLEALAVNAGSTLSPIGNPQNLLIWQYDRIPFLSFVGHMLPVAGVMFVLVALLTWVWLPRERVTLQANRLDGHAISVSLAALSITSLIMMVLMMERGHALLGALFLIVPFALFSWRSLKQIDWLLMATFTAIFLGLGHFAALPMVSHAMDGVDFSHPFTLYLSGIVSSQLISNVPATVLLLERTPDAMALAVAVNVGGFGIVIGSLANLIALRLAKQPHGMRLFHEVSIPFLLVCATLVYAVMRMA
ncbi:SLC13 family permease [Dyella psychrodurans]|uniref:Citrate transporter n=1 Tax=Dyella psychrodurans TaxID=1927960 RepID=A0A370XAG3_9GAMM|nr:SLC13 family permease [Dyella psychrodurans]RDS85423.1 citrate transporter [Dyella psychrodurans]